MRVARTLVALVMGGSLALTACAPEESSEESADSFPERPIELVVPFDPGGGTDLSARVIAEALSDELGVPVNVVNKPGAEQITGVDYVRKAPSDGYTLLADGAASSSLQSFSDNLPFAWDDRTFLGRVTTGAHVYVVGADSPYETLEELLDDLEQGTKEFTTAYSNATSTVDYALLMLLSEAGVKISDLNGVPTDSGGEIVEAVAAGDFDFGAVAPSSAAGFVESGDVRVLAQTGTDPLSQLPDVTTTEEAGYPDLNLTYWVGLSGPPDLPDEIRERLEEALTTLANDPEVLEKLDTIGVSVDLLVGDEFEEYVHSEVDTFTTLRESVGGE